MRAQAVIAMPAVLRTVAIASFICLLHDQIVERAARHRAGEPSLLLTVDDAALGNTSRWET